MKNVLKIVINMMIGVVLVLVWLRFVDLKEIIKQLQAVNLIFVWPAFVCFFLSICIRSYKLKLFMSKVAKIPLKDIVFLTGAAMLFNYLIPIRAGEVLKGIYLGSNYHLSLSKSVIWIFLDRFIDFLTVLIVSAILLFFIPTALSWDFIKIIVFIFAGVIALSFVMVYQPNLIKSLYNYLSFLLLFKSIKVKVNKLLDYLLESFLILKRSSKELLGLMLLSIIAYAADAGIIFFCALAVNYRLSFGAAYLSQLLSALTYLVPAGPGYVGSAEASGLLVFSGVLGIDPNIASAITVLLHIVNVIWIIIFGMISIYFLKIQPRAIFGKIFKGN